MIMDFRLERKWSVVGFCTGMITGLVAVTPAAGNVGTPAAALIGLVSGILSNLATRLKVTMRVDDPMDIFAVHALAGIVGTFMTGIFAQASVINNDGYTIADGGWLDGNWVQLGKQVAWICVGVAWTFVVTYAIMFVINLVPGLHFRASEEAEVVGMDEVEHDEYVADYAWVQRDLEGNAPERTTTDPREFMSEKHPAVGATAEIKSVSQPTTEDGSLASALAGGRADMTAGIRHHQPPVSGQDAEKEMMRGRGEGGFTAEPLPGQSLQRVESDRPQEIRGEDFKRVEARGRGEGGVSDRDHAL
jgi:Amt family ammonium transporter